MWLGFILYEYNLVYLLICVLFIQKQKNMLKIPLPKLKVESSYAEWKNELLMWILVCGCVKKEQGIIVLLQSLSENQKAKKAVSTLMLTLRYTHVNFILLNKLDELFKTEQTQDSYYTYTKFNNFSRSEIIRWCFIKHKSKASDTYNC